MSGWTACSETAGRHQTLPYRRNSRRRRKKGWRGRRMEEKMKKKKEKRLRIKKKRNGDNLKGRTSLVDRKLL